MAGSGWRLPFALRKVGDVGENFDEGTGVCYHRAGLKQRVSDHEGRAESAESLVERNPLTHFGLDLQPFAEN